MFRIEQAVVDHFKRHAVFYERVVHPQSMITASLLPCFTTVVPVLFREHHSHTCYRCYVSKVTLITVMHLVYFIHYIEPASVIEYPGELCEPGTHAIGSPFGNPNPDFRFTLN